MMRQMRSPFSIRVLRYIVIAFFVVTATLWLRMPTVRDPYRSRPSAPSPLSYTYSPIPTPVRGRNGSLGPLGAHLPIPLQSLPTPEGPHPIDRLVRDAQGEFEDLLKKETVTIEDAAAAYRERRGRHPPPGFREWYEFAAARGCIIIEDFFDQVYHDLEPFWALDPTFIRAEAAEFEMTIRVRNGNATSSSDWFWTRIWLDLISTLAHLLPDLDIALNAMDEPRLVVPWETIADYITRAHRTRRAPDPRDIIREWPRLPTQDRNLKPVAKNWESDDHYWPIARRGCDPNSAARKAEVMVNFDHPPIVEHNMAHAHMPEGFVSNSTLASHICHQPDLQGLHGFFIRPITTAASTVLFPMFGGSKLSINNEILLPAPMYWEGNERFAGAKNHAREWGTKWNAVVWRGVATGGQNTPENWRGFQRHRFVAMNNSTTIALAEVGAQPLVNFGLPPAEEVTARRIGGLGEWVGSWSDVGFIDLMCEEKVGCGYVNPYFHAVRGITMDGQFDFKYLPDIDGNSFSGRYLGFLRSTSLPLKSTLFREWHDSRLVAWKHFVPMDSRYTEYYSVMQYFIGYTSHGIQEPGHDDVAHRIAVDGRDWAERVLRREDMQVYTLRLLLEYARVSHDDREKLGWVDDLV